MSTIVESVARILEKLPSLYRVPGAAVAVVKDGELVGQQVWGYADLVKRIPMTAQTIIPICSISKQMTCGLLTDLERNPTPAMLAKGEDAAKQLSDQLGQLLSLELIEDTGLSLRQLCNNQSGIRDYWALTVLWGAEPEGHFSILDHGPLMLKRLKSFHFAPGTQFSYANTNFFILGRCIENATQQPLADLLAERIFAPAGMTTARLCAHTAEHPSPCVGYEGDEKYGFVPGVNCIEWAGDAGVAASLADMIAYEKFIDRSQSDPGSWYRANTEPQKFNDGARADYSYGLSRVDVQGVETVRHGGALRGYRLSRLYAPESRLSIVVLINHEHTDASAVSDYILKQVLNVSEAKKAVVIPAPEWVGCYLDPESQLAIIVTDSDNGELSIKYHRSADKLQVIEAHRAQSSNAIATLKDGELHLHFTNDNRKIVAQRVADFDVGAKSSDLHGDYRCEEIDSTFHCDGQGGMLYGSFDGFLGQGPLHFMRCIGENIWAIACPRAMDSQPPGDWTVVVHRDIGGKVTSLTIGCWLARNHEFLKLP